MSETRSPTGLDWRSLTALALALAILIGLGTWQWQRKAWKEALLSDIAARSSAAPVTALPNVGCQDCDYRRIALEGRFVDGSERHVFISVPQQANGIGGPGYWVFALFETGGARVYVNRGFVPEANKADRRAPSAAPLHIEGVLRLPEPRGRFSNPSDRAKNIYYVRAPDEFGDATRRDLYVDMTGPTPASGLPLPMVGRIAIPNRHLEYALTWYGLAVTLAAIALLRARAAQA